MKWACSAAALYWFLCATFAHLHGRDTSGVSNIPGSKACYSGESLGPWVSCEFLHIKWWGDHIRGMHVVQFKSWGVSLRRISFKVQKEKPTFFFFFLSKILKSCDIKFFVVLIVFSILILWHLKRIFEINAKWQCDKP